MQTLYKVGKWLNRFSKPVAPNLRSCKSAIRTRIQPLESRIVLAATNPLLLNSLDGTNGFLLIGEQGDAGLSVDGAGDVNGDGFDDLIVGAPRFQINGNGAGASFVVFGSPGGFPASIDLSTLDGTDGFRIDGNNSFDFMGHSVSTAGDVNADGFDDLLIGAYEFVMDASDPEPNTGEAYVVFGRESFTAALSVNSLNGSNGFRIEGVTNGDLFGESVSSAGDVNGDGFSDLIIGAWRADGGAGRGDTFVVFGKPNGFSAVVNASSLNGINGFRIDGDTAGNNAGDAVSSAGDINGDGFDDLMIGVPDGELATGGNDDQGQVFIFFGQAATFPAVMNLSDVNGSNGFRINGIDVGDHAGDSISSAGDVNGDGVDDMIVGSRSAEPGANTGTSEGESYVVFGRVGGFGTDLNLSDLDGTNGFRLGGADEDDELGIAVGGAGDVNGDGFDDLIVGAQRAEIAGATNGTATGESYVVFGKGSPFAAELPIADLNGTNGFRIDGIVSGHQTGHSVRGAGDINGDGFDDVIVGTYGSNNSYVIFGGNFTGGTETQTGGDGNNALAANQGATGVDILIGGRDDDTLISDGGADVLRGGEGDDALFIQDAVFDTTRRLVGGNGTDTLWVQGSGVHLDLTVIPDNRIVDIEVIDIVETGNTLTLDLQEVLNISSTSNTLTVFRAGTETVNRGTGWTQQNNEVVDGRTFEVFTQGAAILRIHTVPTITVAVTPAGVVEDAAELLTYAFTRDVTFGLLTVDFVVSGSAEFTTDYTSSGATTFSAFTGSVSFPDGQSTSVVTISSMVDNLVELDETVNLTIAASSERRYLAGSPDTASGTITDDDTATFTIGNSGISEGAGTMSFTVSTSNPVDIAVEVEVTFTNATATGPADYDSTSQLITFPAGDSSSRTVSVPIVDDNYVELTETFVAAISTTTELGSRLTDFSDDGAGTITDNDIATFTIEDVMVNESDGTAIFTVSVDKPLDIPVEVDVLYTDGTAVGAPGGTGAHYDNDSDRVTFAAGTANSRLVTVAVMDDELITGNRDFFVALSLVTDVGTRNTDLTDTAVGTIVDDIATFSINDVTVNEDAGLAIFTVSLDNAIDIPVDVTVSYSDDTATGSIDGTSADFDNVADMVTFAAGDTSDKTVTVAITDDIIVEGVHEFTATLSTATLLGTRPVNISDTGTGTIQDNDLAGFAVTESDGGSVTSEAGNSDDFTVVLTGRPETNVVIVVESMDLTETIVTPSVLTFTPSNWNVDQTVTMIGQDDSLNDGSQTTVIGIAVDDLLSDNEFSTLQIQNISVTNTDDDPAELSIIIQDTSITENGGITQATVRRNTDTTEALSVTISSSDINEATVPTTILIPAGQFDSAPFAITAVDDLPADGTQTVTVTASAAGHSDGLATVDVTDDEAGMTLDIDGDGSSDAATDGILVVRYLFGFRGEGLISGALSAGSSATASEVEATLSAATVMLDIDGNGVADAATDGILFLRYLFGLRGTTLVAGSIGNGATRTTGTDVAAFLDGFPTTANSITINESSAPAFPIHDDDDQLFPAPPAEPTHFEILQTATESVALDGAFKETVDWLSIV